MSCSKNYFFTIYMSVFMVFVFVLEGFTGIVDYFVSDPSKISYEPYRLVTAIFLHQDINHIFQNLFALVLFGLILENIIGSCRYFLLFVVGGVVGNVAGVFAYPDSLSLGASAGIMAVLGTLSVIRPKTVVYFFGPIPLILLTGIWIFIDFVSVNANDNIGHVAHLAGFLVGLIYGFVIRKKYSEEKEIKEKAKVSITEEELDEWEREWM